MRTAAEIQKLILSGIISTDKPIEVTAEEIYSFYPGTDLEELKKLIEDPGPKTIFGYPAVIVAKLSANQTIQ